MPKSALARAISTLRMMSREEREVAAIVWSWARPEFGPSGCGLDEVVQGVADAEVGGDELRDCIQPKTQGDGAEVGHGFFAAAFGGREPRRACSSSATGVACSK